MTVLSNISSVSNLLTCIHMIIWKNPLVRTGFHSLTVIG